MKRPSLSIGLALSLLAVSTGCVERRMLIRSEPSDALVILDDSEVGRSPVEVDFTFYGTRKVTLKKEGYATRVAYVELAPPWYEVFPLDFVSEILLPVKIVDRREFTFTLDKPQPVEEKDLLYRAEELRRQVREP